MPLGGGTSLQKKYGIVDSADHVYQDHTNYKNREYRYGDRDLVRIWADENAPTFEFLFENGVKFIDVKPELVNGGAVPRLFRAQVFSDDLNETINGNYGSGVVRPLEKSARAKGVTFLLRHKMTNIIRESPSSGRVLGITARFENKDVNIQAKRASIIATGGHTSNVEFRRMFDPQLTEDTRSPANPGASRLPTEKSSRCRLAPDCGHRNSDRGSRVGHHQDVAHRLPIRLHESEMETGKPDVFQGRRFRSHGEQFSKRHSRKPGGSEILE